MFIDLGARLLLALALMALGVAAYWSWNRWQVRRLAAGPAAGHPGLEALEPGRPAILYFTTPECVPCRTTQRPALERLQADLGDRVQVLVVDAVERPDVAAHWRVLSVPTLFVLDAAGQPRSINHGVTGVEKLRRQLAALDTAAGR